MNVLLDIIGAVIILGLVILTVTTMNINLTKQSYKTNNTVQLQFEAIQLARIMEFDIYKTGYRVPKQKILVADTSNFKFRANLFDVAGDTNIVEYIVSKPLILPTRGPVYKQLTRKIGSDTLTINSNVARMYFQYYNSRDSALTCPVIGAKLDSIKSVKIYLTLETFDSLDSTFVGALYSKWIYPRNL